MLYDMDENNLYVSISTAYNILLTFCIFKLEEFRFL